MNQHIKDIYNQFKDEGFTDSGILFVCDWFGPRVHKEQKETYSDLKQYTHEKIIDNLDATSAIRSSPNVRENNYKPKQ